MSRNYAVSTLWANVDIGGPSTDFRTAAASCTPCPPGKLRGRKKRNTEKRKMKRREGVRRGGSRIEWFRLILSPRAAQNAET